MPRRSVVFLALAAVAAGAVLGFVVERALRRLPPRTRNDVQPDAGQPDAGRSEQAPTWPGTADSVSAGEVAILRPVREERLLAHHDRFEATAEAANATGVGANQFSQLLADAPRVAVERERFPSGATLLGLAAAVGLVAIGLATWALVTRSETKTVTVTRESPAVNQALAILASQQSQRIPLTHSVGRIVLVVAPGGRAVLLLDKLGHAPAGKSYQAWVIPPGKKVPVSAAVFTGSERVVPLRPVVDLGATVAVTLERAGGATGPSHAPKLVAVRS
jgi:hypothetical protein